MTLAIVAPIVVAKHPNADRLQVGSVLGVQVIVGPETKSGDLGVLFQSGLQLSEQYAQANDLVRRKNEDGSHAGGFFEENRRVRNQKFRGVKSEGYWAPLSSLDFAIKKTTLKVGDRFDSIDGTPICNKYITAATRAARQKNLNARRETTMFRAHFDTDNIKFHWDRLQPGDKLSITLKMHGTSQRTGRVLDDLPQTWWQKLLRFKPKQEWTYLTGSRNVIIGRGTGVPYHSNEFRMQAANHFIGKLHRGETVYYEVVGYERPGVPIMQAHSKNKEVAKQYPEQIVYHYGCPDGLFRVYVYRIVMTNIDGVSVDLTWEQVKARCLELGVEHVPEVMTKTYMGKDDLLATLEPIIESPDMLGLTHPTEGVCIRCDNGSLKAKIYKHKSYTFGVLEGYIKDKDTYVDTEEAA